MNHKHELGHEHSHDGSCCNHTSHLDKENHDSGCGCHGEGHTHAHSDEILHGDEEDVGDARCSDRCCSSNHDDSHEHDHGSCNCESSEQPEVSDDINAKYKFRINGLDCANCAMKVEQKLQQDDTVKLARINFSNGLLYATPEGSIEKETFIDHISNVIDQVEPGVTLSDPDEKAEENNKGELIHLLLSIALFIGALFLESKTDIHPFFLFVVPYIFAGYKVLWKSIRNILKGEVFDENFLMSIATIGAFVVSSYEEAVEVMLFYAVGEFFQSLAVQKSRQSISELMDINSEYANRIDENGNEQKVDPKELAINDTIVIRVGEKVPVDGVILEGSSSLDVSALSGEAGLKDVHPQDEVLAGSLNTNGVFKMTVEKRYEDSTVAKILDLVEKASNKKSPIENFITKFAKIYTPIVVFMAVLLVAIPTAIYGTDEFYTWLYRGCTFLVISCPCALVVSVPLGVFAGIGSASRVGALVKGGNYLELLSDVNCIIFDKTGTITKGNFSVSKVEGDSNTLEFAAYAESYSNHPIAQSILKKYDKKIDFKRVENYKELAGFGIQVDLDGKQLLAGNEKLLSNENIEHPDVYEIGTIIYVAYDHNYIGYIVISDELKETSKQAMDELSNLGITNTVMLTGDRNEVATQIANDVHIKNVHAQLLPQDKVSILEQYLGQSGNTVAFVGDGINDAPALMRSDIGISMGGIGSDVAIEASDIVLMNDDLTLIPKTIKISKKTKGILMQNIVFSLGVKLIVLILTAVGLTDMKMGVFADVGVTLIAILNSMRVLNFYKKV